MTNVQDELQRMLAERAAGDDPVVSGVTSSAGTRRSIPAAHVHVGIDLTEAIRAGWEFAETNASEWAREHPEQCTGRGPTGRLRNFRAMNPTKLEATWDAVAEENNDPEAITALDDEMVSRGLRRRGV